MRLMKPLTTSQGTDHAPQHAWDQVAPGAAEQQAQAEAEGSEEMRTIEQEDLNANAAIFQQQQTTLRGLNTKQRLVVNYHRNGARIDAVVAMKKGEDVKPYRVFVSGPGGVGKSYVISLIHRDTVKLLHRVEPEDVTVLLTAPTCMSGSFQHPRDDSALSTSAWYFKVWFPASHTGQAQHTEDKAI